MNINSQVRTAASDGLRLASAEERLKELGISLPSPPEPFGAYVEAVQTGNLLFLSEMLPAEGHGAKFTGRVGAELDVEQGHRAALLAALNVLAVARESLGSLDRVTRIVRLGVSVATSGDVYDQQKSRMPLRSYCKTYSEKTRVRAVWCMAWQAFRWACRSNWKSFLKWLTELEVIVSCLLLVRTTTCQQQLNILQEDVWQR